MHPSDDPRARWNVWHHVRCPGCRPGEFWGVPVHEPGCLEQPTWYIYPEVDARYEWVAALIEGLDPGAFQTSPASFEDRQALWGVHYLVRALWHVAARGEA